MQVENDYDKEVYNGDIGYVEDVEPDDGELIANFDGRSITYGFGELDTLVPAYAATIHKEPGLRIPSRARVGAAYRAFCRAPSVRLPRQRDRSREARAVAPFQRYPIGDRALVLISLRALPT
jgi:hypothetical protein